MKKNIEMAREASNTPIDHHATPDLFGINQIERFAELVRADERDCVMNEPITKAHWQRFENDIRADEREACAKVCEGMKTYIDRHNAVIQSSAADCAAAIRARGNT